MLFINEVAFYGKANLLTVELIGFCYYQYRLPAK